MRWISSETLKISVLSTSIFLTMHGTAAAAIAPTERDALVALYNATGGATDWNDNTGWLSGDPCAAPDTWKGVICDSFNGPDGFQHVSAINLSNNGLTGQLPDEIGDLAGLKILRLTGNDLSGPIPSTIGNLGELQNLYLDQNKLSGEIPTSIGNLKKLTVLGLGANNLSGSVPSQIGEMNSLEKIYFVSNKLSGSLPDSLKNLANLKHLYIDYNAFTGEIPDLSANLALCDTNASNIPATCSAFSYNALTADHWASDINLYDASGDFSATQTVAPKNVTASTPTDTTIDVSWDVIRYQGGTGRYVVTARSAGNPDKVVQTGDKATNTVQLTGLTPATTYAISVQTVTEQEGPPGFESYTRTITSLPSPAVDATTTGNKPSDGNGGPDGGSGGGGNTQGGGTPNGNNGSNDPNGNAPANTSNSSGGGSTTWSLAALIALARLRKAHRHS